MLQYDILIWILIYDSFFNIVYSSVYYQLCVWRNQKQFFLFQTQYKHIIIQKTNILEYTQLPPIKKWRTNVGRWVNKIFFHYQGSYRVERKNEKCSTQWGRAFIDSARSLSLYDVIYVYVMYKKSIYSIHFYFFKASKHVMEIGKNNVQNIFFSHNFNQIWGAKI
jgi:hypothetical protein